MRISDWSADVCSSDLILRLLVVVIDHGGDLVVGDPEHCREETEAQIFGGDLVEKISEQRSVVARDRPQGQAQPRSGHPLGEGRDIGHTITSSSMLVHTERTITFRHHRARRCAYERNSAAWSARRSEEPTSDLQSLMRISYPV